jgi:5'-deoxynucleotidase
MPDFASNAVSPFYAHLARLRFIKRWGLMRNAVEEDVAQHSWEVAVLAPALAVISQQVFGRDVDPNAVAAKALFHDATEAITGDLPTPVKYSPAMRHASAHLEDEVADEMLKLVPPQLQAAMQPMMDHRLWTPQEQRLVKAADRLSAWLKCRAELRYGNREFEQAEAQIKGRIDETAGEEVAYFLAHFAPAYEQTLDSLMQGA